MRFNTNIKRCLIILLTLVLVPLFLFSSGSATWHILVRNVNSGDAATATDPTCTVNFLYYTTQTTATKDTANSKTSTTDVSGSYRTDINGKKTFSITGKWLDGTSYSYESATYKELYNNGVKEYTFHNESIPTYTNGVLTKQVIKNITLYITSTSSSWGEKNVNGNYTVTYTTTNYSTSEGIIKENGTIKFFIACKP